jgi:hypothetical protein
MKRVQRAALGVRLEAPLETLAKRSSSVRFDLEREGGN